MKNVFLLIVFNLFFILSAGAMIPASLTKLATVSDKNSEAYMFLSQEAAIDTKNAAERMLDGENSAGALKILEVAIHLMPHRSDLSNLRKTALETYVKITKKLEEESFKNCELLQERYQFLKSMAPDALAKLKLERSCASTEKKNVVSTDVDLLNLPEPKVIKELEEEFKPELVKTFPWEDMLANSFMLLRSLYGEEFRVVCSSNCSFEKMKVEVFQDTSLQYCGYIEGLLSVSHGKKSIMCIYQKKNIFKTTPELYKIYAKAFDNAAFDDDVPTYAILNMTLKYMNRSEAREVLVVMDHKSFKKGNLLFTLKKGDGKFETLNAKTDFSLTDEERKDLHDVTFSINYMKTFSLYQKHFKNSLNKSLPEMLLE